MAKKLGDLLLSPELFGTPFVDKSGNVYVINEVHSNLPSVSLVRQFFNNFFKRSEIDCGLASCRLSQGIRYTIDLKEHLGDRANPSQEEIKKSEKHCVDLLLDNYKNRIYFTA